MPVHLFITDEWLSNTELFSSFRFEYHAAAEVIKAIEFEEVDGMFNSDIT